MIFVTVGGVLCASALTGWVLLTGKGRDTARMVFIKVMRFFN